MRLFWVGASVAATVALVAGLAYAAGRPAIVAPPSKTSAVVVTLDVGPTGAPVTVAQGQTLTFQAPAGGTIDKISKMPVNAPSYSAPALNVGTLSTPVTWHDANGSYTTTIPVTVSA